MTILGAGLFFVVFPKYFDPSLKVLQEMLAKTGQDTSTPLWTIVIFQTLFGVLIAPFINSLFSFGEEFGWRAYLQPKLMPLGGRKAILLIGLIWVCGIGPSSQWGTIMVLNILVHLGWVC